MCLRLLSAGEHRGPIVLNKQVHLFSEVGAKLVADGSSSVIVININAKRSIIDGLKIIVAHDEETYHSAVEIYADGCILQNCDIKCDKFHNVTVMSPPGVSVLSFST